LVVLGHTFGEAHGVRGQHCGKALWERFVHLQSVPQLGADTRPSCSAHCRSISWGTRFGQRHGRGPLWVDTSSRGDEGVSPCPFLDPLAIPASRPSRSACLGHLVLVFTHSLSLLLTSGLKTG
jgi:hypothetical protein